MKRSRWEETGKRTGYEKFILSAGICCDDISENALGSHWAISGFRVRKSSSFPEVLVGISIPDTLSGAADHGLFSQSLPGSSELTRVPSWLCTRFATIDFA